MSNQGVNLILYFIKVKLKLHASQAEVVADFQTSRKT